MCTVVATVLGALGSVMQGVAANNAAKAEASAAEQNARIADLQATEAVKGSSKEEMKLRRQMQMLQGRQRAVAAASGLNSDAGSMADIQDASMREGEQDVSVLRMNAARESWGYQVQGTNYRNKASAARAAGKNAMLGGFLGAGGSLLSLAAPVTKSSRTITIDSLDSTPYSGTGNDYYSQWAAAYRGR